MASVDNKTKPSRKRKTTEADDAKKNADPDPFHPLAEGVQFPPPVPKDEATSTSVNNPWLQYPKLDAVRYQLLGGGAALALDLAQTSNARTCDILMRLGNLTNAQRSEALLAFIYTSEPGSTYERLQAAARGDMENAYYRTAKYDDYIKKKADAPKADDPCKAPADLRAMVKDPDAMQRWQCIIDRGTQRMPMIQAQWWAFGTVDDMWESVLRRLWTERYTNVSVDGSAYEPVIPFLQFAREMSDPSLKDTCEYRDMFRYCCVNGHKFSELQCAKEPAPASAKKADDSGEVRERDAKKAKVAKDEKKYLPWGDVQAMLIRKFPDAPGDGRFLTWALSKLPWRADRIPNNEAMILDVLGSDRAVERFLEERLVDPSTTQQVLADAKKAKVAKDEPKAMAAAATGAAAVIDLDADDDAPAPNNNKSLTSAGRDLHTKMRTAMAARLNDYRAAGDGSGSADVPWSKESMSARAAFDAACVDTGKDEKKRARRYMPYREFQALIKTEYPNAPDGFSQWVGSKISPPRDDKKWILEQIAKAGGVERFAAEKAEEARKRARRYMPHREVKALIEAEFPKAPEGFLEWATEKAGWCGPIRDDKKWILEQITEAGGVERFTAEKAEEARKHKERADKLRPIPPAAMTSSSLGATYTGVKMFAVYIADRLNAKVFHSVKSAGVECPREDGMWDHWKVCCERVGLGKLYGPIDVPHTWVDHRDPDVALPNTKDWTVETFKTIRTLCSWVLADAHWKQFAKIDPDDHGFASVDEYGHDYLSKAYFDCLSKSALTGEEKEKQHWNTYGYRITEEYDSTVEAPDDYSKGGYDEDSDVDPECIDSEDCPCKRCKRIWAVHGSDDDEDDSKDDSDDDYNPTEDDVAEARRLGARKRAAEARAAVRRRT